MNEIPIRFRPLLAASIDSEEQLTSLRYPMVASPKVDGIRCLIHPRLGPVTRSLKEIRSRYVYGILAREENLYLDGEITCGPRSAPDVFNRSTRGVMSFDARDDFTYWVFDRFADPLAPYHTRWLEHEKAYMEQYWEDDDHVKVLPWVIVTNPEGVLGAEQRWLAEGFEGIMLRDPSREYKIGNRSTLKEQYLLKLKRFKDAEAIVVGVEPRFRNANPQTRNNLGYAERSSHLAGQIEDSALGSLHVRDQSGRFGDFNIGSGYTEDQRIDLWNRRNDLIGRTVNYKYQEVGILDQPRFPIFRGFRED